MWTKKKSGNSKKTGINVSRGRKTSLGDFLLQRMTAARSLSWKSTVNHLYTLNPIVTVCHLNISGRNLLQGLTISGMKRRYFQVKSRSGSFIWKTKGKGRKYGS